MGCGSSQTQPVLEDDRPMEEGENNDDDGNKEKMESVPNTPDHFSEQVEPATAPAHQGVPRLDSPPSQPQPPPPQHINGELSHSTIDDIEDSPPSAGTRGVAFDVVAPGSQTGGSLIKRHPPKKFQKLEELQQGPTLTPEQLEEKQAIAEKRRNEILNQRVQSAKQRSAKSARARARLAGQDEVDQLEDGRIESAQYINTSENGL